MAVQEAYTAEQVLGHIRALHEAGASFRQIARFRFDGRVSYGVVARAVAGIEPANPEIRRALGLPIEPELLAAPRLCECGCQTWFIPKVPHQKRLPGHPRRRHS